MSRPSILFFFLGILFFSCRPELSVDLPEESPRLVVWGTLHPDSLATVYLSETFSPLSNQQGTTFMVSAARVILYENGQVADTLPEAAPDIYRSIFFQPTAGKTYAIRALKTGYPDLQTRPDTMPEKMVVTQLEAKYLPSAGQEYDTASIRINLFHSK